MSTLGGTNQACESDIDTSLWICCYDMHVVIGCFQHSCASSQLMTIRTVCVSKAMPLTPTVLHVHIALTYWRHW